MELFSQLVGRHITASLLDSTSTSDSSCRLYCRILTVVCEMSWRTAHNFRAHAEYSKGMCERTQHFYSTSVLPGGETKCLHPLCHTPACVCNIDMVCPGRGGTLHLILNHFIFYTLKSAAVQHSRYELRFKFHFHIITFLSLHKTVSSAKALHIIEFSK